MDTRFFVSREEFHNVQMDVRHLQAVQSSQMDRLQRLEKRQQDDVAIRSAWSTSPFPSALVGTPQHGPIRVPSTEAFDLDEQSQTLGSLHLEPDDEPIRRAAAASRANSVRFDESANLAQSARNLSEIGGPFRPGGGLMMERSLSHKSDGRHSSAGHSVHSVHSVHSIHSMASGRSSLALETSFTADSHDQDSSPVSVPEPPPVFFVLGPVPAIVRCWLTKDFANNTLLYAAICSGARKSTVELSLIKELGLEDLVYREEGDNTYKIHLQTYLAEAIRATKSADPVPQIPYLAVDYAVVGLEQDAQQGVDGRQAIRIFIGSDALRTHSADLLFSRNIMSLYSSEREKLTVPFVRPEDDAVYKNLCTTSIAAEKPKLNASAAEFVVGDVKGQESVNSGDDNSLLHPDRSYGDDQDESDDLSEPASRRYQDHRQGRREDSEDRRAMQRQQNGVSVPRENSRASGRLPSSGAVSPSSAHLIPAVKWPGAPDGAFSENGGDGEKQPRTSASSEYSGKDAAASGASVEGTRRDASAIWGSWRQGTSATGSDGGHRETGPLSGYQPAGRPRAMKVLGKLKTGTNAVSARTGPSYELPPPPPPRTSGEYRRKSQGLSNLPVSGGENRSGGGGGSGGGGSGGTAPAPSNVIRWESKRSISSNLAAANSSSGPGKDHKSQQQQGLAALEQLRNSASTSAPTTPRSSNPVGGASAFAWMKTSKPKTPTATAE